MRELVKALRALRGENVVRSSVDTKGNVMGGSEIALSAIICGYRCLLLGAATLNEKNPKLDQFAVT